MSKTAPEIDLEADAKSVVGDLTQAIKLSQHYLNLVDQAMKLDKELAEKMEQIRKLETVDLPEAMDSCGAKQLPLLAGGFLEIKKIIKASLPSLGAIQSQKDPEKKQEMQTKLDDGLDWLRKNGAESLIKNFLSFEFDKGQDNVVGEFVERADELGISHLRETNVHSQSLEKLIKEKMAAGVAVPKETFSIFTGRKAVIVKKKSKE